MTRRDDGFTLLELLVSITIFAFLMVLLVGALQLGSRQVGRLTAQVDRSSQIALAQDFLRAQLGAAQPLVSSTSDSKIVQFGGDPERIDFVAVGPESLPSGGLQMLSIGVRQAPDGVTQQVVVGWRPLREDGDAPHEEDPPTVLLDGLRTAKFVYYGPLTVADNPDWQTDWQNMEYLPLLVRLSATFADGETMPDLTIALRLSSSMADLRLNHNKRF